MDSLITIKILTIFFSLTSLAAIFYVILRLRRSIRAITNDKKKISETVRAFNSIKNSFSDDTKYFRYSWTVSTKEKLLELKETLKNMNNIFLSLERKKIVSEIEKFINSLEKSRSNLNETFFVKEKERYRDIFYENNQDLLTEEQVRAVLSDDDRNLIVAGAGSGKTKVIDFKIRYLIRSKKVSSDKIVLLSFSRKSAGDLARKISKHTEGIEVRTIHAFSARMLGQQGIDLFNEKNKEMELLVLKALAETLNEKNALSLFTYFYEKYFYDLKPLIFYNNLDELRSDLKKANSKLIESDDKFEEIKAERALKTLKGEFVRSIDERYIADFLYIHDIEYQYEKSV